MRKVCSWPLYHSDLKTFTESKKIQGLKVNKDFATAFHNSRQNTVLNQQNSLKDVTEKVSSSLKKFTDKLSMGLKNDVFSPEDRNVIKHTKIITDLKCIAENMKKDGPAKTGALTQKSFIASIRELPVKCLEEIPYEVTKYS